MTKLAILLSGLALTALPCTQSLASDLTFSFTGSDFSAIGNFDVSSTATPGIFSGTSVDGIATVAGNAYTITGLAPYMNFLGNDNLYFTGDAAAAANLGRPFDFQGFAFFLSNGDAITLFSDAGSDFEILGVAATGQQLVQETAPITVTPEPGSLALLGTGAIGMLGLLRRKFTA